MRRLGFALGAALALAALFFAVKFHRRAQWRAGRDAIQAAAEAGERSGHPWAGVYLSRLEYGVGGALCVAPDGSYFGALTEGWGRGSYARALGEASVENGRLVLTPKRSVGTDSASRLSGTYRIVRWGDIKCLIRPDDAARFVHCAARGEECKDFIPFCTRGYIYGYPDLPEELAGARREDPKYRPVVVRSVSGPERHNWGWSWRVELGAGRDADLKKGWGLSWDGSQSAVVIQEVGAKTAIGEIGQDKQQGPRMKVPLKAGMTVSGWRPVVGSRPDFVYPMADFRE